MDNKIDITLKKIYNEVIGEILKEIDIDYHNTVKQGYYNNLKIKYSSFPVENKNYDMILNKVIQLEKNKWSNLNKEEKMHLLIKDNNLEKIKSLSNQALALAKERIKDNKITDENTYNEIISNLNNLSDKVHSFNSSVANWYIIEGTSDISFAANKRIIPSNRIRDYERTNKSK